MDKQVQEHGVYIPSIEACWLYKLNKEKGDYVVEDKYLDKLLNGKLDYSFELLEDKELINNIAVEKFDDDKYYTLDVINVKFKNKYKKSNAEMTTKQLRDWCYKDGFIFNGKLMTNWKRSGGKARVGQDLFLINSIKDKCLAWARMDLKFDGNIDIGSIRAYESLPLSSIIGTIEIDPKNILVIDDFKSKFDWKMSKTWLENGELKTETKLTQECNSIWDGEGLLSNKVFKANDIIKGKGVALLRNRYTKCAAFNCYIEKFFREYCEEHGYDYETYEIEGIDHKKIKVKDILLITTPSAIKIYKYNDNKTIKEAGYEGDGAWLQYWKDRCGFTFAICKTEKPCHDKYGATLSYQMVNTITFKKDELHQLVAPEIKYAERLKADLDFFLQEVNRLKEISEEEENDNNLYQYDEEDNDNEIEIGTNIDVADAFIELVKDNPDFAKAQVFKDYRRNFINAYITRLRQGKIRVKGADYCVACGNPIEMLYATVGEFHGESLTLKDNELYCSRFKDGEDIVGFRNPHINFSNIGIQVNKFIQEINDYMNCTPNIVFLNSIKYPILSTYQGEDFDIDSNLLMNDIIICKACRRIDKSINGIPVNGVENTGDNNKKLTAINMSDVDDTISHNYIGDTVNLSQQLNSLMNHAKYNNLLDEKELDDIYDMTSKCSSISCCEIDKAKKQFQALDVPGELDKMKANLELVDNWPIRIINNEINILKQALKDKKTEVMKYRSQERKPYNQVLRELKETLRINNTEKLSDEKVKELQEEISRLVIEISNINKTDEDNEQKIAKRKPILKKLRPIQKTLSENEVEKLSDKGVKNIKDEILSLDEDIKRINVKRQSEIDAIKNKISEKYAELKQCDGRIFKPYFFKFIGDNESKKKRRKTNKGHRKELDRATILKYAHDNNIQVDEINRKDKEISKLLKVNDEIQKKWENAIYRKLDTPMDWLQDELDKIENKKKVGTVQVIQLVKKNKHKANEMTVDYIIKCINYLDTKIKGYRANDDLTSKEKLDKIRSEKKRVVKEVIRSMKLSKTDLYGVLKKCLNSVKNNGKVQKKSGIESLSLEILFKAYGTGLLGMFVK